jgi:hypothetical protein
MFWTFMSALAQESSTFRPDPDYFFDKCASIAKYNSDCKKPEDCKAAGKVPLSVAQKKVISYFFKEWILYGDWDSRKLGYILGTVFRESEGTFCPVREAPRCCLNEDCREKEIGRPYSKKASNGQRYYGRGYIQLTGSQRYKNIGTDLGVGLELYDHPDTVMQPDIAAEIAVRE